MSVRLRLRRMGAKNKPAYRVVAADQRSPRDGKFIEVLGFYDPRREREGLDLERAEYWISCGAQPSATVNDIIRRAREGRLMTPPEPVTPVIEAAPKAAPAEVAAPPAEEASVAVAPEEAKAEEAAPAEEAEVAAAEAEEEPKSE